MARLLNREPPAAIEAECALLGSMMLDSRVIGDVIEVIQGPDDFYRSGHSAIYEVLVDMFDRNDAVDMVQINQRLTDLGQLEKVGGLEYLIELAESVPHAASARYYAQTVRDKAMLRELIDAAGEILHDAYGSASPVTEQLEHAEQMMFRLGQSTAGQSAANLNDLLQKLYDKLTQDDGRSVTGLETGFFELDEMTSGLHDGEMIIIAARPSMGKTALALNIAEHIAVDQKKPVAIFSLEMSRDQLAQRLLCSRSGVDSQKMRRNMLGEQDFEQLRLMVGKLSEAPLYIDDTPGLSLLSLRAKARRLASRHDIEAILIDYMQLMHSPGYESRQQEVTALSMGIKALARELSVPVVCLSQLNRGPESREGHRPRMSDLRESGSIEQDADVVLMLHREDYYQRGQPDYEMTNKAELIVAKQRNGPTGIVELQFNGRTTRFNNLAKTSYDDTAVSNAPF
ncbi:MAG: replicative DNA helicase [Phycisphaeraceae bacterium]|nr:replicative DNA helicase [Phycisphaeraceae bacterium]